MKKIRKTKALSIEDTRRLLGAEPPIAIGRVPFDPIGMRAIAGIVRERLISRGGRPSDPAWTISRKVPMRPDTWKELDRLARLLHEQDIRISAGQVAAIALERGLPRDLDPHQSVHIFASREQIEARGNYEFSKEVRKEARQRSQAINQHGLW